MPVARHSKTPTLAEWHEPRSSALMMTSLASASYPSRWARVGVSSSIAVSSSRHLGVLRVRVRGDLRLVRLHLGREAGIADGEDPHGQEACVAGAVHRDG